MQRYHLYFLDILNIIRKEMQVKPNNKSEMKPDKTIKQVSTIARIEYRQTVINRQLVFKDQEKNL